jgi:type II secretory pathway predicted ATPase ExeA
MKIIMSCSSRHLQEKNISPRTTARKCVTLLRSETSANTFLNIIPGIIVSKEGKEMIELLSSHEEDGRFENYFGFRETPFGVTPDPRFFYSNPLYLEGLAALVYGVKAKKGFMLLTGEVGTGKTILLRKLMRQLEAAVQFVFISSSHLTSYGLVEILAHDFGLGNGNKEKNRLEMIHGLNVHLIEQLENKHTVAVLIDEGQNLSDDAIEGLCSLSNLETDEEKLLQIVLVGQPELAVKLNRSSLRRVKQRIAIHYRLHSLHTIGEVENYMRHRLQVAGYDGPEIFNKEAIEAIWHYSAGTPRLINIICDNSLATACESGKKKVSAYMVMKAANALLLEQGSEVGKLGLSESGPSRVKAPAARSGQKRVETAAIEVKKSNGVGETYVPVRAAEELVAREAPAAATVSPHFFDYMSRIATAAMGPMASLVLRDQISVLGESHDAFPQLRIGELIELVSREILNEIMRTRFQKMMFQEIEALKTVRLW